MPPAIRKFAFLFVISLAFHLAGTWTLPLIDRDEPRFAEASREMLERGDYVVPYFNNRYRFDKPPLTYWCQALSYRLFGENDFAARFPSTIAAALTALLLLAWGGRTGNERIGWWAAIIFTFCTQTFIHGKAAVADMWLVLFVTAAHWAGYELLRDRLSSSAPQLSTLPPSPGYGAAGNPQPSPRWWWLFYLSLALAFLAKGPIGWTPLLTVLAVRFHLPEAKLNRRFLFFTGLLVTLSLIALWGIPALARTNGEFLRIGIGRHVIKRSFVAMEGHGGQSWAGYILTLPFYFVTIFVTFFPWSLKLTWLGKRLWRERDSLDNYLLGGAAIIFLGFTLVQTKLPHYTLPAFPLLALLLAKALAGQPTSERFVKRAVTIVIVLAFLAVLATPFAARFFPSMQLMRQARPDLTSQMEFGAVRYREPSLVWYFRRHVDGWMNDLDENTVADFMNRPGPRFIILPTKAATELYPTIPAGWKRYTTEGVSTANLKWVQLTLLLKSM